ncbi:MAG: hypothetical protein R2724_02565 [Bryobacterales bacterium]
MSELQEKPWVPLVSLSLKVGLALALAYVAYDYFSRPDTGEEAAEQTQESPLQADLYVYPAKTNISTYETAQRLVGMDLWTKEGWRWTVEPGDRLLAPLEKVVPTRVYEHDGELRIEFDKDDKKSWLGIGVGGRVFVDEIFFIEDPEELDGHWTEQDWERVRNHEAWTGMSEHQAIFSLGYGRPVDVSPNGKTRIVEFPGRPDAEPVVITFRDGVASEVR